MDCLTNKSVNRIFLGASAFLITLIGSVWVFIIHLVS